jgi:hypothetical protein
VEALRGAAVVQLVGNCEEVSNQTRVEVHGASPA